MEQGRNKESKVEKIAGKSLAIKDKERVDYHKEAYERCQKFRRLNTIYRNRRGSK